MISNGKLFDHQAGIGKGHDVSVVVCQQSTHDAENRCGQYFVKAESNEGAEPAPKQELQLIEYQERDEDRANQTDYCGSNRAVCYDDAHYS